MTRLEVSGEPGQLVRAPVRARIANWPYEPDVAQIILLDHHMLPTLEAVNQWVESARAARPATHTIRTGAMFPEAAEVFHQAGFNTIDTLALLERRLDTDPHTGPNTGHESDVRPTAAPLDSRAWRSGTQRLRAHHLPDAAALDRLAFGDPWGNDVASLTAISDATARHRARIVTTSHHSGQPRLGGFAITGQSGAVGYLQRLAVDPDARRQGIARALVTDSLHWMRRRGATTAMVNTALDNDAALALYADAGFHARPDTLTILELSGQQPAGVQPAGVQPAGLQPTDVGPDA